MASTVLERERTSARPWTAWAERHDEALRVANEQLHFWRQQGLGNYEIFRELNAGVAPHDCVRDDLICLIAARWLGIAG